MHFVLWTTRTTTMTTTTTAIFVRYCCADKNGNNSFEHELGIARLPLALPSFASFYIFSMFALCRDYSFFFFRLLSLFARLLAHCCLSLSIQYTNKCVCIFLFAKVDGRSVGYDQCEFGCERKCGGTDANEEKERWRKDAADVYTQLLFKIQNVCPFTRF